MVVNITFQTKINKTMRLIMIGQGADLNESGTSWLLRVSGKTNSLNVITEMAHAQKCPFVMRTVDFD